VATIAADLVMSSAPRERAGAASGLNETSSEFGGALGIALLGSVLTVLYRGGLGGTLPDGLSGEAVAMALRGIGGAYTAAETLPQGGAELLEAARVAYADAMLVTSLLGAAIVLIAAVTTIAMFRGLKPATA
jgi:DHA2 family multidrug resistance protein-like MFS transporter